MDGAIRALLRPSEDLQLALDAIDHAAHNAGESDPARILAVVTHRAQPPAPNDEPGTGEQARCAIAPLLACGT